MKKLIEIKMTYFSRVNQDDDVVVVV